MNDTPVGVPASDWKPDPLPTASVQLPPDLVDLVEDLARHIHAVWGRERLAQGWRYGPRRDDARKEHPSLVPYEQLAETEKDVDRGTALEALRAAVVQGYRLLPGVRLDRLAPEVLRLATPHFVLRDELAHLELVLRVGAPEAAVFYGARIVEALAAEALRRLGQTPNPTVFVNLQVLEQLGQVGTSAAYWAHALRRLGNQVRHVEGTIGPDDATLAALFAEHWLGWFCRRFSDGAARPTLTRDGQPLWLDVGVELSAVLRSLEALEAGTSTDLLGSASAASGNPALFQTPVTVAVFAEILLARSGPGDAAAVLQVLEAGLARFPDDLRLRQVMGLYWRRERQPARALTWLEPLLKERPDDEETVGILAGACKGLWEMDRANREPLVRAHRLYRQAWKRSSRESAYVGINAAATALWLGQADVAGQVAGEVEALLRKRTALLPEPMRDSVLRGGFWHWVTLAEAQLLQGDWATAGQTYRDAFAHHAGRVGDIQVACKQRDRIVEALGLPPMEA